jgi:hypothetical protein
MGMIESAGKRVREQAPSRWDHLPRWEGKCRTYGVKVQRERIGYVNAILESYEWIARLRTEDVARGVLEICVPEEWDELYGSVVRALACDVEMEFLD